MIRLDGADLAWESHGSGEPALLLVHGYTGGRVDWDGVVGALAERRRVVSYDQRGHGESGRAATYSFDALVADLAGVVERLDLAPVHLLGHSMGGVIALRHALERPADVASLVLMDTAAEPAGGPLVQLLPAFLEIARSRGMPGLADHVTELTGRPDLRESSHRKLGSMDIEAFAAFGRELGGYPSLRSRLPELACPVTVIVGENDHGLRAAAEVLAAEGPGARLEVIADAGHSPQEDQPAAWLAAVEGHLARCR